MADPARLQLTDGSAASHGGPGTEVETRTIQVDGQAVKLDSLGPMIINTDGTVSRISNWTELSETEQARSLRLIAKRNRQRTEALEETLPRATS